MKKTQSSVASTASPKKQRLQTSMTLNQTVTRDERAEISNAKVEIESLQTKFDLRQARIDVNDDLERQNAELK